MDYLSPARFKSLVGVFRVYWNELIPVVVWNGGKTILKFTVPVMCLGKMAGTNVMYMWILFIELKHAKSPDLL